MAFQHLEGEKQQRIHPACIRKIFRTPFEQRRSISTAQKPLWGICSDFTKDQAFGTPRPKTTLWSTSQCKHSPWNIDLYSSKAWTASFATISLEYRASILCCALHYEFGTYGGLSFPLLIVDNPKITRQLLCVGRARINRKARGPTRNFEVSSIRTIVCRRPSAVAASTEKVRYCTYRAPHCETMNGGLD